MPFSYIRSWPVARILAGVAATVVSMLLLILDTQHAALASLMPGRPRAKPAVRKVGPSFLRLRLGSSEHVSPTCKRLRFQLPSHDAASGLDLCSAVLTTAWPKGSFFPVVRPYTPVNRLDERGFLELTVKRYPGGKMSTHLHSLVPGDTLLFVAAMPGYRWTPNKHQAVTLIAGGVGITPIFQLAQGILSNPLDKTAIELVYGADSDSEMLFRDQFARWQARFPGRFSATYVVRSPGPGSGHTGADISVDLLARLMPLPGGSTKVFVCGPPALERALEGGGRFGAEGFLGRLGYAKGQIHKF